MVRTVRPPRSDFKVGPARAEAEPRVYSNAADVQGEAPSKLVRRRPPRGAARSSSARKPACSRALTLAQPHPSDTCVAHHSQAVVCVRERCGEALVARER